MLSCPSNLKTVARRLLALEAAARPVGDPKASAAFNVCEKLGKSLRKLTGARGYQSLLARALGLATEEVSWLRALHLNPSGALEGLNVLEAGLGESDIAAGETVLVAHLLALLVTFIGPRLTQGIVQEIWPAIGDLNF